MKMSKVSSLVLLATAIGSVSSSVYDVAEDGKVNASDLVHVPSLLASLKDFVDIDYKALPAEIANVDAEGKAELAQAFRDSFNIANDDLEQTIEIGFGVIADFIQAINVIKNIGSKLKLGA